MVYTDKELLADLRDVAEHIGSTPTQSAYREHGTYDITTFYTHFGSWQAAVAAAGFEPNRPSGAIDTDALLAELTRLADELDRAPTATQMKTDGEYSASVYIDRFGSWNAALEAAGLDRNKRGRISDTELLDELTRLGEEFGGPPSAQQMAEQGAYNPSLYASRFGSWNQALVEADFDPRGVHIEIADSELIAELHRLAEDIGRRPTTTEMAEQGAYSPRTYTRRFDSWRNALDVAFDEVEQYP